MIGQSVREAGLSQVSFTVLNDTNSIINTCCSDSLVRELLHFPAGSDNSSEVKDLSVFHNLDQLLSDQREPSELLEQREQSNFLTERDRIFFFSPRGQLYFHKVTMC